MATEAQGLDVIWRVQKWVGISRYSVEQISWERARRKQNHRTELNLLQQAELW